MSVGKLSGVRVVLVNNFPGPGLGGGEVLILKLARGLAAAGADVSAVVVPGSAFGAELRSAGNTVVEVAMAPSSMWRTLKAIAGQVDARHDHGHDDHGHDDHGHDDGHGHGAASQPCAVMGTGYWTNMLVRRTAHVHAARVVNFVGVMPGASIDDGGSRTARAVRAFVDKATASRVDAHVAVSHSIAAALVEQGAEATRVHTIPNGVDIDALRAAAAEDMSSIPSGTPLVACVARLEPVKGVEYLVRAAVDMPDVTVAIAGAGPLGQSLRDVARELGVADRVTLLGRVSSVEPLLAAADVVVLPSLSEGMPTVALEAMALGRPLVATRVGGTPEVVEDGVTGLLVEPADPAAIAAAVQRLVDDPALAKQIGDAGAERVRAHFSVDAMCAAYVDLLTSIIG